MADDPFDGLDSEVGAPMLVIEDSDKGLEVDDPSGTLSSNDRIAILLKALILELGDDIAETLATLAEDAADEEDGSDD